MAKAQVPLQRVPMIDGDGLCITEWYLFFRRFVQFAADSGVDPGVIQDILDRLTELENAGSSSFNLQGLVSVQVYGTPANGAVQLQLVNDVQAPGNTQFYGTGAAGAKGWFALFAAFIQGEGISLSSGSDGRITVALADLADSGVGTLLAITRDAKGRLSGSRAAVAGDLPQHPHNSHSGIQGGSPGDYQHLTAAQVAKVDGLPNPGSGGPIILGGQMIQAGTGVVPASGSGSATGAFTFPAPFAPGSVPVVTATPSTRSNAAPIVLELNGGTTELGFTVIVDPAESGGGGGQVDNPVPFNWIAIGLAP